MKIIITPSPSRGSVTAIASKSMLHRAIIAASLASGTTKISNITISDDINATINACSSLGATIKIYKQYIEVKGIAVNYQSIKDVELKNTVIDVGSSATTLRFLIPLFSLFNRVVTFKCSPQLFKRQLDLYLDLFKGNLIKSTDSYIIKGPISFNDLTLTLDSSSQFGSGLILAYLFSGKDLKLSINGDIVSKPYIDMTVNMLNSFNADIKFKNNCYFVNGVNTLVSNNLIVEGDYTNSANYLCLGAINKSISVNALSSNSLQGDIKIIDILRSAGANIEFNSDTCVVKKSKLNPVNISLVDNPDLGPILFATLSLASGVSTFKNTFRLSMKESNRVEAMRVELAKLGVVMECLEDEVRINPVKSFKVLGELDSHNDHRICMALCIISSVCKNEVVINNCECVNKSNPRFFDDLRKLGIKYELK